MAEHQDQLQSDEDVDEILRLAVRQSSNGLSLRERLMQSGLEIGLTPEEIQRAETDWLAQKEAAKMLETEKSDRALFRKTRRMRTFESFGSYIVISGFLLFIDFRDGVLSWCYWPIVGLGVAFSLELLRLFKTNADDEQAFQKWRLKRQRNLKSFAEIGEGSEDASLPVASD